MSGTAQVTALVVAGRRPGIDPLAAHFGIEDKALIPIAGKPMLLHVVQALLASPQIGKIIILAQQPDRLIAKIPELQNNQRIIPHAGGDSVSMAVASAIEAYAGDFPFVLTTADNALLTPAVVAEFIAKASGNTLAVGMVERRVLQACYPDNKRTWLKFRGGAWSGANLFWLGAPAVRSALEKWQYIEQDRKKGRAVVGTFGPFLLIAAVLRLISMPQAIRMAGRKLGLDAALAPLSVAEAAIDVDKLSDYQLVEKIMSDT